MTSIIARETPNDRTSPIFWNHEANEFHKYAKVPMFHFTRYAARFAGDFRDVAYATQGAAGQPAGTPTHNPALANLTNLAARRTVASLYYRNPRFMVRVPRMERSIFTPLLAEIESTRLDIFARRTNLYRHMRRMLLDGALGPFFVGKLTYSYDLAVDPVRAEEQRDAALLENLKFTNLEVKPRVKDDDYHQIHRQAHEEWIAAAERGEIVVPKSAVAYMKKHVKKHDEAEAWARPTETMRNCQVNFRRINPRNFSYDPWNDDLAQREWMREHYVARLDDVLSNSEFSAKAKKEVVAAMGVHTTAAQSMGTGDLPEVYGWVALNSRDKHVHMYEVLDRVKQKIVTYADGCSTALLVRDWSMGDVMPSGPYVEGCFMDDPMNGFGVCLPYIYEAHQEEASILEGVINKTVETGGSKLGYDATAIDEDEIKRIAEFGVGDTIPFKRLNNRPIKDVLQQTTQIEPSVGSLNQVVNNVRWVDRLTGFGSANLGGGDFSKTATATDVVNDAVSVLVEDMASVVDMVSATTGKIAVRYMRALDSQETVRQEVGDDALLPGGWPIYGFARQDIVNDHAVEVVPGSSRRNNSALRSKQLLEGIQLWAAQPIAQAAPEITLELNRRYFDSIGEFGLDWDGALSAFVQQTLSGASDPNAETTETASGSGAPRPSEMSEPSRSGMMQGQHNVGGGRMPTGASHGDNARPFRGGPGGR